MTKLIASEKNALALAAREELAWQNYEDYFKLANPGMKMYPHVKLICNKLQKIANGEQHFYIISMPPQHGKSLTITKTFPSYYLMKYPDKHSMVVAYSHDLSSDFATSNRRNFTEWCGSVPYPGLNIGTNTAGAFAIRDHDGGFFSTSVLGGATGMSADLLIIDDPVKNAEEAGSMTVKNKIWDEWNSTFYPRLQRGGSIIVIMTRWQMDDLAGRLLTGSSLPWEEIKFPAIAEDIPAGTTDAIGRHNGDALCPELHSLEELKTHKHDMGTAKFTALYQQSPIIEGGNIFKQDWIRYYVDSQETAVRLGLVVGRDVSILPRHFDQTVQAWDATFKSKENDDFVAGQTWSKREAICYLRIGWCHKRLSFTETLDAIRSQSRMYPEATAKLVEDKANGPAIIDTLRREIPGIMPVSPGNDSKEARAASVSPMWEAGQVMVPHPKWHPEVQDLLTEVWGFPNMPHDDYVDSMVYALRRLNNKFNGPIVRY